MAKAQCAGCFFFGPKWSCWAFPGGLFGFSAVKGIPGVFGPLCLWFQLCCLLPFRADKSWMSRWWGHDVHNAVWGTLRWSCRAFPGGSFDFSAVEGVSLELLPT